MMRHMGYSKEYEKLLATSAKRKAKIIAMREAGLRDVEIARALGVSHQRVTQIAGAKKPRTRGSNGAIQKRGHGRKGRATR